MKLAVLIDRRIPPIIRDTQHPDAMVANGMLADVGVSQTAAYGEPGVSDFEDWAEAVCRYVAAVRFAARHGLEVVHELVDDALLLDLRAFMTRRELHEPRPNIIGAPRATPYGRTAAFAAHAHRPFVVCRNDTDAALPFPTLAEGMRTAQTWRVSPSHPADELVWKQATGPDKAYPVAYLPNNGAMAPDLAFQAYGAGGLSILQARVPMGYETRFFVVDGEIVSGAGAIERFTPFDRSRQELRGVTHPVFDHKRNGRNLPDIQWSIADVMDKAAPAIAADFVRDLTIQDFALDLYMNLATAKIGVVEVNPINGSGFYANDGVEVYTRLAEALLKRVPVATAA